MFKIGLPLLLLGLFLSNVLADEIDDARAVKEQAYTQYIEALHSGGTVKTQQQIDELKQKILDPAIRQYSQQVQAILKKNREQKDDEQRKKREKQKLTPTPYPSSPGLKKQQIKSFTPPTPPQPEVILNGDSIPKELVFSGVASYPNPKTGNSGKKR